MTGGGWHLLRSQQCALSVSAEQLQQQVGKDTDRAPKYCFAPPSGYTTGLPPRPKPVSKTHWHCWSKPGVGSHLQHSLQLLATGPGHTEWSLLGREGGRRGGRQPASRDSWAERAVGPSCDLLQPEPSRSRGAWQEVTACQGSSLPCGVFFPSQSRKRRGLGRQNGSALKFRSIPGRGTQRPVSSRRHLPQSPPSFYSRRPPPQRRECILRQYPGRRRRGWKV